MQTLSAGLVQGLWARALPVLGWGTAGREAAQPGLDREQVMEGEQLEEIQHFNIPQTYYHPFATKHTNLIYLFSEQNNHRLKPDQ